MQGRTIAVRALPALIGMMFSGYASAAAFQLLEQNGAGVGNAFAGTAALAEDASTVFWNPAGMTLLPGMQISVSADFVKPKAEFSNNGSTSPALISTLGGNGGDAGDWAAVPAAYFTWALTPQWSVGLGISAPFGLATEYDDDWVGRFHAIKSEVTTININPSVAFKVNDAVSLGFGLNYQRIEAELTNAVNYAGLIAQATGNTVLLPGVEGVAKVEGDDEAWGWNVGALFQLSPTTRVGLSYRSTVDYTLEGNVTFGQTANATANAIISSSPQTANGPIKADIELPDVATLSVYQKLTDQWEMMGDLAWTGWSSLPKLQIDRANGTSLTTETLDWKDTWRVSLGANYKYNEQWKIRMGVAYDETPVQDETRLPRVPDADRIWLAFGAQYRINPNSALDFGYAHIFVDDPTLNTSTTTAAAKGILRGEYDSNVNILGVQYSMKF